MQTAITTLEVTLGNLRTNQAIEPNEVRAQAIREHEDALNILRSQVRPRGEDVFSQPPLT